MKKSPHLLDLNTLSKKPQPKRILRDVLPPKTDATLSHKSWKIFYEEISSVPSFNRWAEGVRMMALGLAVVFFLNIMGAYHQALSLKDQIVTASYESYESIVKDPSPDDEVLTAAAQQLAQAQKSLWFLKTQRTSLLSQANAGQAGVKILEVAEQAATAAGELLTFLEAVKDPAQQLFKEVEVPTNSPTESLSIAYQDHFKPAFIRLTTADQTLQALSLKSFPLEFRDKVASAQIEIHKLAELLAEIDQQLPILTTLLGNAHPQRYLVLLQNNHELRPGGGFIGSYLLLDLNDGYIQNLEFHDVYEIDGQFHESIQPPAEIAQLTDQWGLRDSNYSPDLPTSLKKAAWFLEKEGGPTVDHVVMVDLYSIQKLLELTGPISLSSLKKPLNTENFPTILSYLVESKASGVQDPKAIFRELVPAVQTKLEEQKRGMNWVEWFSQMTQSKHIAFYSKDETLQSFWSDWGADGAFAQVQPKEDYFMMVQTNIGGNKSDAYIQTTLHHETVIEHSGKIQNQVTLTRQHQWTDEVETQIRNELSQFGIQSIEEWVIGILGDGPNRSGIRLYVPTGTQLLGAQGIPQAEVERHHDEALNLDYFYFESIVYPEKESTLSFQFELPFTLDFSPLDEYRLLVGKQPSEQHTTFTKTLRGDTRLTQYRSFPEALLDHAHEQDLNVYTWTTPLDQDLNIAQLWGK